MILNRVERLDQSVHKGRGHMASSYDKEEAALVLRTVERIESCSVGDDGTKLRAAMETIEDVRRTTARQGEGERNG